MKNIFGFVLIATALNTFYLDKNLEEKLLVAQTSALKTSTLKSAKGYFETLNNQVIWRKQYIKELIELRKGNTNDTIILSEQYRFDCDGCPANYVEMFSKSGYKYYSLDTNGNKIQGYKLKTEAPLINSRTWNSAINGMYLHKDYEKIKYAIKNGIDINKTAHKFGTDNCDDGTWVLYTILFPDNKVSGVYMRCWNN